MKIKNTAAILVAFTFALALTMGLMVVVRGPALAETNHSDPYAISKVHYVNPDGYCGGMTPCYSTIQAAVDATAYSGDSILVAEGIYTDTNSDNKVVDVGSTGSITITGGYRSDFSELDPDTYTSTIDGLGTALGIYSPIGPTIIENFEVKNGYDTVDWEASGVTIKWGPSIVRNCNIHHNTGGGLITGGPNTIVDSNIINNNIDYGVYSGNSNITLTNNIVYSNTDKASMNTAGGITLGSGDTAYLEGNKVFNNSGTDGQGIYLWGYTNATLVDNQLYGNYTGIYIHGATGARLENNDIYNNLNPSIGYGRGILCTGTNPVVLVGNKVHGHRTIYYGWGPGIGISGCSGMLIVKNEIFSNTVEYGPSADGFGGGLYILGGTGSTIEENYFYLNSAEIGSAIYIKNTSGITLTNNMLYLNDTTGRSGAVDFENSNGRLMHNTFARNKGSRGAGIFTRIGSSIAMTNTILVSNTVGITVTTGTTATLDYTMWGAGAWSNGYDYMDYGTLITGTNNFWGNPDFVDPEINNYHIGPLSAGRDTGVNVGVTTDIDGDTRPIGAGYEIGADEYDILNEPVTSLQVENDSPTELGYVTLFTATVASGDNITYTWDFGNGHTGSGDIVSYTYPTFGNFTATVTATNAINTQYSRTPVVITDTTAPAVPSLLSPENLTRSNNNTPTFDWNPSSSTDTAGYIFKLNSVETDVGKVTQYSPGVLPDFDYSWSVAAYDALSNTSEFSAKWLLTIDTTPPSNPPTRLTPVDDTQVNDTHVYFSWINGADAYGSLLDLNGTVIDVGNNTNYAQVMPNGTYTWTMASYDDLGNTAAFLPPWRFTARGGIEGLSASNDSPTRLGETTTLSAAVTSGANPIYNWEFGDGTTGSGAVTSHVYTQPGIYEAQVTASNPTNSLSAVTTVEIFEDLSLPPGSTTTTTDGLLNIISDPTCTGTFTITYSTPTAPTHAMGDLLFGDVLFHLDAVDSNGDPVTTFSQPMTLTVSYDESSLPGGMNEADLQVYRYDVGIPDWVALPVINRDLAADKITVALDHFSEFILAAPSKVKKPIYLPMIVH